MGREFRTLDDFRVELNTAIEKAIENRVVDGAKEAIQESEDKNVYSYEPKFDWALSTRRKDAGGIRDKKNMVVHSEFGSLTEKTIEIEINAPWQWAYPAENFGMNKWLLKQHNPPNPSGNLAEAVENNIYGVKRPFMNEAETTYASGEFETDLSRGLAEQGFDN